MTYFVPLDAFRTFALLQVMYPFRDALLAAPWALVIALAALCGAVLDGLRLAATVVGLPGFVAIAGYRDAAMVSTYLVTLAVARALLIGVQPTMAAA